MYHTGTPTQTPEGHWLVPVARDSDGVIVAYGTSVDFGEAVNRAELIVQAWNPKGSIHVEPAGKPVL